MIPFQQPLFPFGMTNILPPPIPKANAIFWAYDDMQVPPSVGAVKSIQKLVSLGSPYGRTQSICIYSKPNAISPTIKDEFHTLGVHCLEDDDGPLLAMMTDMLLFAVDNKIGASMTVVCSSPQLNPVISSLKNRGYEVVLVHKNTSPILPLTTTSLCWQEVMGVSESAQESQVVAPNVTQPKPPAPPALNPSPPAPNPSPPAPAKANGWPVVERAHLLQFLKACVVLAGPDPPEELSVSALEVHDKLRRMYPKFPKEMTMRSLTHEGHKHENCTSVERGDRRSPDYDPRKWSIAMKPHVIIKLLEADFYASKQAS